jgi:photosystem II stability/assembly factor-like uncharacterized protein
VRPSDVYAFICQAGVWKSTDYGGTWSHVSTGAGAKELETGKPWGAGIDSNPCRDPATPPVLYTFSGAGATGFWRSTDGGVNWTRLLLPSNGNGDPQDGYSVDVDPYDGKHVLVGYHEAPGLSESSDGGSTWRIVKTTAGVSTFYFFVDTGDATTTRRTWLGLGQSGSLVRTADAGATWTTVNSLQHAHGCAQIFQAGGGVLYLGGTNGSEGTGIYRSTDYGVTLHKVMDGQSNGVVASAKNIYSSWGWASATGVGDPNVRRTARAAGMPWTQMSTPAAMNNGAKRAAVTSDGTHAIIISGNWNAGLWRYIEP